MPRIAEHDFAPLHDLMKAEADFPPTYSDWLALWARLTGQDIETPKAKERAVAQAKLPAPPLSKDQELDRINASDMDQRMKSFFRRRNAQLHRRPSQLKPTSRA